MLRWSILGRGQAEAGLPPPIDGGIVFELAIKFFDIVHL